MIVINHRTPHFASTKSIFSLIQISLPNFAFFYRKNHYHLALLKDRFLKKMLLKRAKPVGFPPSHKTIGSNNSFITTENNFRFLR